MIRNRPAAVLSYASVATFALVNVLAVSSAGPNGRILLLISAFLAISAAVRSARGDRDELGLALFFSLPPLASFAVGWPLWASALLAALLLVAAELNVLANQFRLADREEAAIRSGVLETAQLGGAGLSFALLVGLVPPALPIGGTATVLVAAIVLIGLAILLFGVRQERQPSSSRWEEGTRL